MLLPKRREPTACHFRVHFERYQRLAAPFPSHSLLLTPKSRPRVAHSKARVKLIELSEKQYQASAGLARNCRFFLSSVPVRDRALRASGTPSNLIDRVRYSLLKSLREKLDQFAGAHSFKELTTLSFRLASPVPSGRDRIGGFETAFGAPSGGSDRPKRSRRSPNRTYRPRPARAPRCWD